MTDRAASASPTCIGCGYSLRGLSESTCPECGRAFDLTDWKTFLGPGLPTRFERRFLPALPFPYRVARFAVVGIAVVSAWCPAINPLPGLLIAFIAGAIAIRSRIRDAVRISVVKRYALPAELARADEQMIRRLRRLLWSGIIIVSLQLPFFCAYFVSYPFLIRVAKHWWVDVPWTVEPPHGPHMYGLFYVTDVQAGLGGVTFELPLGRIVFEHDDDSSRMLTSRWLTYRY